MNITDRYYSEVVKLKKEVFIRSSPDIRWKCYKNTANSRTKEENSLRRNMKIGSEKVRTEKENE